MKQEETQKSDDNMLIKLGTRIQNVLSNLKKWEWQLYTKAYTAYQIDFDYLKGLSLK